MKNWHILALVVIALGGYIWWSVQSGHSTSSTVAYRDGTFTGKVVDSVYGPVQAVVTISGGKIRSVDVPVFPNSPGHTTEVSAQSIPILKQEAITTQSAQVDIVSGATQTTEAFQQSVASALAQAV